MYQNRALNFFLSVGVLDSCVGDVPVMTFLQNRVNFLE